MSLTIAFVTPGYDPRDIQRGSGTFYHLAKELEHQGCKVHWVGPLIVPDPLFTRIFRVITRRLHKGRYQSYLDPWVARARSRFLARILRGLDFDFIMTNDHGIVAENATGKPVVIYTDVMFSPVDNNEDMQYTPLHNIPSFVAWLYRLTIRKSLKQATLSVFPAEWQRRVAKQYGVLTAKMAVIPFGANIPDPGPDVAESRDIQSVMRGGTLHLLFVGKDWVRKGGPMAVKISAFLRESGIDAILHVVGPQLTDEHSYVKTSGLLDKNNKEDWARLDRLYRECHIFIFPSQSEGSAIVPREASAYGLPTLAYHIDGLVGAVENGVSGILLGLSSSEATFSEVIQNWLNNPAEYKHLSLMARKFYEQNAYWPATVTHLLREIDGLSTDG